MTHAEATTRKEHPVTTPAAVINPMTLIYAPDAPSWAHPRLGDYPYGSMRLTDIYRAACYAGIRSGLARLRRAKRARERRETRGYHRGKWEGRARRGELGL